MPISKRELPGILEKIFWISVPIIMIGIASLIPMIYGLKTDIAVMQINVSSIQYADAERSKIVQQTWEMSNKNNVILQDKADNSSNSAEHQLIIERLSDVEFTLSKIYHKQIIGFNLTDPKKQDSPSSTKTNIYDTHNKNPWWSDIDSNRCDNYPVFAFKIFQH